MQSSKKIFGSVNINLPMSYTNILVSFGFLLGAFILYSLFADFTEFYQVKGYLNTKGGIIRVYPLRPGIIRKRLVQEGQLVKQGDILYHIYTSNEAQKTFYNAKEYQLLRKKLLRIESFLKAKTAYLYSLKPLLRKHYISLAFYQHVQEQLVVLEENRHDLNIALMQFKDKQEYVIRAPISGLISSLEFDVGQNVTLLKSLLTIIPQPAHLMAQLYIPVSKSGFLRPSQKIALRYDAYPYQHFGVGVAHILSISRSILSDSDEEKPIKIGEPYYKIIAHLDRQDIVLYGQSHLLQQGMTCSALIQGVHKSLWHWLFDPLFRYSRGA